MTADYEPYVCFHSKMPQENANRCDVRWCAFSDGAASVNIEFGEPGNFRAWPYLEESVMAAAHPSELQECGYVNVNIDQAIQGVGGNDSWGAEPLDKYKIDSHITHIMTVKFTRSM